MQEVSLYLGYVEDLGFYSTRSQFDQGTKDLWCLVLEQDSQVIYSEILGMVGPSIQSYATQ
jgi:hypothetical protein